MTWVGVHFIKAGTFEALEKELVPWAGVHFIKAGTFEA